MSEESFVSKYLPRLKNSSLSYVTCFPTFNRTHHMPRNTTICWGRSLNLMKTDKCVPNPQPFSRRWETRKIHIFMLRCVCPRSRRRKGSSSFFFVTHMSGISNEIRDISWEKKSLAILAKKRDKKKELLLLQPFISKVEVVVKKPMQWKMRLLLFQEKRRTSHITQFERAFITNNLQQCHFCGAIVHDANICKAGYFVCVYVRMWD